MTEWLDEQRQLSARMPRRYATIQEAFQRMRDENKHLNDAQARHLTYHGVNRNEDGSYSWKFDNYARTLPPNDITRAELAHLWRRITCPMLLVFGEDSWASRPDEDGRLGHFQNARLEMFARAGHWVQHDRLDDFITVTRDFLKE